MSSIQLSRCVGHGNPAGFSAPPLPYDVATEVEAAVDQLNACLEGEGDYMWLSSLLTTRALAEYNQGKNADALATLMLARKRIDQQYRDYQGFGQDATLHYLWLLARIADLGEATERFQQAEEALQYMKRKCWGYGQRVADALAGCFERGDANTLSGFLGQNAKTEGSPLPEIWRRLPEPRSIWVTMEMR